MNRKVLVMFSGGLDSRLVIKMLQEQGLEIIALMFKLPFSAEKSNFPEALEFVKTENITLEIFDCTQGELLQEYLADIKSPHYGRGASMNPCIDCKLFMYNKAREYAEANNISIIASGDVLNERPMSQNGQQLKLIETRANLSGRLLRPLSAKLLEETEAEKNGLVNREKLLAISGRGRRPQLDLAASYSIKFPSPAGGCLLCDANLKNRIQHLLNRGVTGEELSLLIIGRHFLINNCWVILGRDAGENALLKSFSTEYKFIEAEEIDILIGPSVLFLDKANDDIVEIVKKLIWSFSKGVSLEERQKFDQYKI